MQDDEGIYANQGMEARLSFPKDAYDRAFGLEDVSFWFRHRNEVIRVALERFPPGKIFLDIGGGNGVVSWFMTRLGYDCILIEPAYTGCRNAIRRGMKKVIWGFFQDLPITAGTIPSMGLFDVLEHIERPIDFLAHFRKALRLGGRLYITVPAHTWLWSTIDTLSGHFRRYTVASLRREVEKAGLRVEYVTYFFTWFGLPIFCLRSIPYRLGIGGEEKTDRQELDNVANQYKQASPSGDWILKKLFHSELRILHRSQLRHGASVLAVCVA